MNTASKIGPNSIIQTVAVLESIFGKEETEEMLTKIGQGHLIGNLPSEMVEESKFHALVAAIDDELGEQKTRGILEESGSRTAAYLLRVRIPGLFQKLLKLLPTGAAYALFLFAISKNAWTFAGSGDFTYTTGKKPEITVRVSHPTRNCVAGFYEGTFTTLLRTLVSPKAQIRADIRQEGKLLNCTYHCEF